MVAFSALSDRWWFSASVTSLVVMWLVSAWCRCDSAEVIRLGKIGFWILDLDYCLSYLFIVLAMFLTHLLPPPTRLCFHRRQLVSLFVCLLATRRDGEAELTWAAGFASRRLMADD